MSTVPARLRESRRPDERRSSSAGAARLEVVVPRPKHRARRRPAILPAAILAMGLLVTVLGHALVAQDQVRLSNVETQISAAQVEHHEDVAALAELESPSRIVRVAEDRLHMSQPPYVTQLPYVSLSVPLRAPHVTGVAASGAPVPGA